MEKYSIFLWSVIMFIDNSDSSKVTPDIESFKNHEKFFVICVIVKFCSFKHTGTESDQIYFFFFCYNQ